MRPRPCRALLLSLALQMPVLATLLSPGFVAAQATSGVSSQGNAGPASKMMTPLPAPGAQAAPALAGAVRTINWEALVPANWDPFKDFKDINLQNLDDGDPKTIALMKRLREAWDNAPNNPEIVGQLVRLPGFVVPLEDSKEGLKEFLLVPYFGACIHSPPPPANQTVHVLPRIPAKGLRSMDTVWITGTVSSIRTDSYMGAAGYRIEAAAVAPYQEKRR
jgi:uncharacterized protein